MNNDDQDKDTVFVVREGDGLRLLCCFFRFSPSFFISFKYVKIYAYDIYTHFKDKHKMTYYVNRHE